DFIPVIAEELANEAWVLCFDEFQVTDIADAMILRRLITGLVDRGVVIITTSNRHPDDLYKNGLQRQSFLPCIELIKSHCRVVSLNSGTDYRKLERERGELYLSPLSEATQGRLEALWILVRAGQPNQVQTLHFLGRDLVIPQVANGAAQFSFYDLCAQAHSAVDYLQIARRFHTVFLTDVPRMNFTHKNEVRRLITLIDTLYENHVVLVMSAEAPAAQLFHTADEVENTNTAATGSAVNAEQRQLMDDLGLSSTQLDSPIFSGEEEIFAFQRAVSRLVEMQSKLW
ncbi:AFG1-like ATPase-domain-containing protein, partial [Dimargaris cristalligena]